MQILRTHPRPRNPPLWGQDPEAVLGLLSSSLRTSRLQKPPEGRADRSRGRAKLSERWWAALGPDRRGGHTSAAGHTPGKRGKRRKGGGCLRHPRGEELPAHPGPRTPRQNETEAHCRLSQRERGPESRRRGLRGQRGPCAHAHTHMHVHTRWRGVRHSERVNPAHPDAPAKVAHSWHSRAFLSNFFNAPEGELAILERGGEREASVGGPPPTPDLESP